MRSAGIVIFVIASLCLIDSTEALVYCPSADLTGDRFVDIEDFVLMANQWLTTDPCIPDDMAYIPYGGFEMGNHFSEGTSSERPLHAGLLDSFLMGKYEVTNRQYCDFLNAAEDGNEIKVDAGIVYASSDDSNSYPYCDTSTNSSYSQIDYNNVSGTFSVRTKGQPPRDMSNDPMVLVSWYGAAAYCNWKSGEEEYQQCYDINDPNWECDFSKKGYRLPTEAEWEYAARGGKPYRRFPWGDKINHDCANYAANGSAYTYDMSPYTTYTFHPDWNDGIYPYTSPAGSFSANCFRLFDMAGNVWEWCNDWYNSTYYSTSPYDNPQGPVNGTFRVLRGGSWKYDASHCRMALRCSSYPIGRNDIFGFRVVRDFALADCPSADLTGDCFVDFEDFALIANQWLISEPSGPYDMAYIPYGGFEMGNHFTEGFSPELPLHAVLLDSFYLGKYEITNRQYCDFLNSAEDGGEIKVDGGIVYASSDAGNSYPYCDTSTSRSYSQIVYSGGVFSVRTKPEVGGRDMSDDPMVQVSWYGSAAYCNWRSHQEGYETCYNLSTWDCDFSKKGYRLPTEAEWEYAARGGSPYYRFPWGDTITHSQANYCSYWEEGSPVYSYDLSPTEGFHPDCNDGIYPYTSVVSSFSANGFGLYDMVGNVFEWCNDWHNSNYYTTSPYYNPQGPLSGTYRVLRGGSWADNPSRCRSAARFGYWPDGRGYHYGFRIVRDLEPDLVNECYNWQSLHPEWIFCDDFEVDTPFVRDGRYFEYDNDDGDFAAIAGLGLDFSKGMRVIFQSGEVSAGGFKLGFGRNPNAYMNRDIRETADFRDIYYRMYLKMQDGWQGSPAKLSRATSFSSSTDWSQAMIAHLWSSGDYLLVDPVRCVNPVTSLVKCIGYNDFAHMDWLGNLAGVTPIFDSLHNGIWFCVEAHVKLNDPGLSNGIQEFWIDGNLEARRDGLNFVASYTDYAINAIFFENYWNNGSPKLQERYFDNIVVSTQPIGCLGQ